MKRFDYFFEGFLAGGKVSQLRLRELDNIAEAGMTVLESVPGKGPQSQAPECNVYSIIQY